MRPVPTKSEKDIEREWDRIAILRAHQIASGKDISFLRILMPCVRDLSAESDFESVVDVGCGTGFITRELAEKARRLVAVDLSRENLRIAQDMLTGADNVTFINDSIERFALTQPENSFTLAVANMTLVTTISLDGMIQAISRLLEPRGHFVFTITHPWFWPLYWGYHAEKWFEYTKEIFIETPFKIALQETDAPVTTHVHRSLEQYIRTLAIHGFYIEVVVEPMPASETEKLYPEPWKYPRFMGARCVVVK